MVLEALVTGRFAGLTQQQVPLHDDDSRSLVEYKIVLDLPKSYPHEKESHEAEEIERKFSHRLRVRLDMGRLLVNIFHQLGTSHPRFSKVKRASIYTSVYGFKAT